MVFLLVSCGQKPEKEVDVNIEPAGSYQEIKSFDDLVAATNVSKDSIRQIMAKHKQPVVLYFSGYACVNCRRMEDEIVHDRQLLERVSKHPLIALKVDDRTSLPKNERFISAFDGDSITNYGQRAIELETKLGKNYQPCLVKLDDDFKVLDSLNYSTFYTKAKVFFGEAGR